MENRKRIQISCIELEIKTSSIDHLKDVVQMLFDGCKFAEAFKSDDKSITLYYYTTSSSTKDISKLPFPLDKKGTEDFLIAWLKQAKWDDEPDHDGSNEKGFKIVSKCKSFWEDAGKILTLSTDWIEYHK